MMEHRLDVRVPLHRASSENFITSIHLNESTESEAVIENLSAAGILIRTHHPLRKGDTVSCKLVDRASGLGMQFQAEARWITAIKEFDQEYRVGFAVRRFESGSKEMWEELRLSCIERVTATDLIDTDIVMQDREGAMLAPAEMKSGIIAVIEVDLEQRSSLLSSGLSFDSIDQRWNVVPVSQASMLPAIDHNAKLNDVWQLLVDNPFGVGTVWRDRSAIGVVSLRRCARLYTEQQSLLSLRQGRIVELERSIAAHELRGPVGLVKSTLELVANGSVDTTELRESGLLEGILGKCDQSLEIVDRYLHQAKAREKATKRTQVNLNKLSRNVAGEFDAWCAQKKIRLVFEIQTKEICIWGIELELCQIVRNLMSNAIKYSTPNSAVTVVIFEDNADLVFQVIDHGIGIAEAQLHRLFSPFGVCGNAPTAGEPQSGIGLYLTKQLVESNRGHIEIKSSVNQGTVATVRFPRSNLQPEI